MKVELNKISKQKMFNMVSLILVYVICLMLLPFEQLSFFEGQAFADSNDLIDYSIGMEEQNDTVNINSEIKKTLWQINVTPAIKEKDQIQKKELQFLIEQINSFELSLPDIDYNSESAYEAVSNEPEETVPQEENTESNMKNETSNNKIYESITEQTIQKLKKMAENPEEVENPYEIGNTLYLSNNIGEAAAFYQEALKRKKPEDMSASDDRAWLLFQAGNSLRTIDMLSAADMYGKLITEYPDSPWAGYARVQRNVITWYISDKPDELLKQNKK
ncbi:MAG: hypothetical protein JXA96_00155 [Sedimentisphaerales bacterium]|nr:hypothetical protein [Sedimentisphaerales bacterium]